MDLNTNIIKYSDKLALLENFILGINKEIYFDLSEKIDKDKVLNLHKNLKINIQNNVIDDTKLHLLLANELFIEQAIKGLDLYVEKQYSKLSAEDFRDVLLFKGKILNRIIENNRLFIFFQLNYLNEQIQSDINIEEELKYYYSYDILIKIYNELPN